MGIAKSAETQESVQEISVPAKLDSTFHYDGVPVDLYSFFSISPETVDFKDKDRLKDIYEYSKSQTTDPTIGNIMHGIRKLSDKIGITGFDKQHTKMWNWIKLTNRMKDLDKRRQALERMTWL